MYALHIERLHAQVSAERQVVAAMKAAGADGLSFPDIHAAIDALDADLLAEPVVVAGERAELLAALGVKGHG